jgi:hypothetical protein
MGKNGKYSAASPGIWGAPQAVWDVSDEVISSGATLLSITGVRLNVSFHCPSSGRACGRSGGRYLCDLWAEAVTFYGGSAFSAVFLNGLSTMV